MTSVLIVDDHQSMCESLARELAETGEFRIAGILRAASLAEAFCAKLHPELVFLDVCTEGGASGLSAAAKLRRNFPALRIIVMSGFDEVTYAPRAREAGAQAFLYKSKSLQDFVETARRVMRGETCFPAPRSIPVPRGESPLTARELEVLRLRCVPMKNRQIAEALCISEDTVETHIKNMKRKTGFSEILDLILWVSNNGWINPNY